MGIKSFQGPLDEMPFHSRNYLGTKAWACLEVMAHRAAVVLASMACEASATYQQVRPSYSVESVKFFLKTLGILEQQKAQPFSILELGTGTGKFTRVLMEARYWEQLLIPFWNKHYSLHQIDAVNYFVMGRLK